MSCNRMRLIPWRMMRLAFPTIASKLERQHSPLPHGSIDGSRFCETTLSLEAIGTLRRKMLIGPTWTEYGRGEPALGESGYCLRSHSVENCASLESESIATERQQAVAPKSKLQNHARQMEGDLTRPVLVPPPPSTGYVMRGGPLVFMF